MFVIVRHGNTFSAGEVPRRIGARTDLPLTEEGVAQALALAAHFAAMQWRFARVLASPLRRTLDTARLIMGQPDSVASAPELESCDWLCEIDHGADENQSEDQVIARIGSEAMAAWDREAKPPPGWIVDAGARTAAWRDLFAADASGPTLVVTSNGNARFALLADPALRAAATSLASLKLPTGSYGVIRRGRQGGLEVPIWGKRP